MHTWRHLFTQAAGRTGTRGDRPRFRPRLERLEARDVPVNPTLVDPNLAVRTVASGLSEPTSMAFIGQNDFLILERSSGQVKRVTNGTVQSSPVLDLAVNSFSERGLLGIALHPDFPRNRSVYLFWTESTTGADSGVVGETSVLGNRVDRYVWNGSSLIFAQNIIRLRAIQVDAGQAARGNHDGGILRFGPDGKLYIYFGDNGRRGQMQNLPDGPGSLTAPAAGAIPQGNLRDDQFGGPEPDDAHLTGVILRLNPDGSTPRDNPFFRAGPLMYGEGTEAAENLQKVFAYGIRNGFGMAFDPVSGRLWEAQNGDDSFSEINQVSAGDNLGWVQVMGPLSRIGQFKTIETTMTPVPPDPLAPGGYFGLQQVRWPPTNIANTPEEAMERMFQVIEGGRRFEAELDGAHEVPRRDTRATGEAEFRVIGDNRIRFELEVAHIENVVAAHIHLGAAGQNGPVVADLFIAPTGTSLDVSGRRVIAEGTLTDADVRELPGFGGTVEDLILRIRQGRAYVNVHTNDGDGTPNEGPGDFPGGEIRGPVVVTDERPASQYSDPEFSWKFEVAPGALGFIEGRALGREYRGDMITGAARPFLLGGQLFHFDLSGNRRRIDVDDPRLEDLVADNRSKFEITESESLLFGENFGVVTDIQTGPNGNLFVVSISDNAIYEIFRRQSGGSAGRPDGGKSADRRADEDTAPTTEAGPGGVLLGADSLGFPTMPASPQPRKPESDSADRDSNADMAPPSGDPRGDVETQTATKTPSWLLSLDDEEMSLLDAFADPIRVTS